MTAPVYKIHPTTPLLAASMYTHAFDYVAPNAAHFIAYWEPFGGIQMLYTRSIELYSSATQPTIAKLEMWRVNTGDIIASGGTAFSDEAHDPDHTHPGANAFLYGNQQTYDVSDPNSEKLRTYLWDARNPLVMEFDPRSDIKLRKGVHEALGILCTSNALNGLNIGGNVVTAHIGGG